MLAEASPDVRIWHLTCGFVRAAVSDRRGPALLLRPARTGRPRLAAGVCANYVPKFGGPPSLMRSVGSASGRLDCSSGRLVSTRPLRLLWKPIGRSCARRFAGGWTADGMPCPVLAGALDH